MVLGIRNRVESIIACASGAVAHKPVAYVVKKIGSALNLLLFRASYTSMMLADVDSFECLHFRTLTF